MTSDSPIVEEVRQRRCELSERFGDDLRQSYQHPREQQAEYALRLVDHPRAIAPYWVIWYDWAIVISVACRGAARAWKSRSSRSSYHV